MSIVTNVVKEMVMLEGGFTVLMLCLLILAYVLVDLIIKHNI